MSHFNPSRVNQALTLISDDICLLILLLISDDIFIVIKIIVMK